MEYYDEQILEARWEEERRKHTTLETGIYVEDDLITFSQITLPDTKIRLYLPEQFVVMPDQVREVKYPSLNAPDFIITSLDSTVNFCFNILPVQLEEGDTKTMSSQFQNALRNVNPSIRISERVDNTAADKGSEMSWFGFKGYALDGQNYNRMYIIRMRKTVLHGIFNCPPRVKDQWEGIVEQCFQSVEELWDILLGGMYMQRTKELTDFLQTYRAERKAARKEVLEESYQKMLPALTETIDHLVKSQADIQETEAQRRIKYLCFFRLRSSGYTQSHEIALAMADKKLYLDEAMDCIYWMPDVIHEEIEKDMEEAENLLAKAFIRLEKYELFHIRQQLLSDDWELFCGVLPRLVKAIEGRITGSSLLLEDGLEVLCGGYMEEPETVCCINTKEADTDGK